ncbi:MAG: acetate--CoA ligase family protein [Planctomycetia bacterium]
MPPPAETAATRARHRCHGYRPGLRTPCRTLAILIPSPATPCDRARLDALDQTIMAVFQPTLAYPADRLPNDPAQPDLALAGRVLWLGSALIEALGLPVFEPGRVISITQTPSGTHVRALVPVLDGIAEQITQQAFAHARDAILPLLAAPADVELARRQGDWIDSSLFRRFDQRPITGVTTVGVLRAAFERDIPFRHVDNHTYQLGWGCRARWTSRSAVDTDAALGMLVSHDKQSTASVLRRAGLPAAEHVLANSPAEAVAAADRFGWPVVVKPVDRDRGEGVVAGIRTIDDLVAAYHAARQLSGRILVERHVPGVCHRLQVIGGRLQFVSKRLPKGVWGDGVHTVTDLVAEVSRLEQEKPPWKRLKPFPTDERARAALVAAGLAFESVPPAASFAPLRDIQSTAEGGVVDDFTDRVHPDNVAAACRAARLFRLDVAGIDMISVDITRSWRDTGAIINEVNFSPLLGETDRAREANRALIAGLVEGDGRIPVEVFVGGAAALEAARHRLATAPSGYALTSHAVTLDTGGAERPVAADGLFGRCLALLMDRDVTGLVAVVQTDEWLEMGMPVDRVTTLMACPGEIGHWQAPDRPVDGRRQAGLLAALRALTLRTVD